MIITAIFLAAQHTLNIYFWKKIQTHLLSSLLKRKCIIIMVMMNPDICEWQKTKELQ